ncbi:biotin transporter BioY [Aerococcus urinae]|uniref:Biotin transporter n=1 Tax=Aerococcus urinae TaxID=1376 RepID=A0A0X8FDQ8_9LACT|nr:biotin transporter BioY [Aerococcus urinae]AMB95254.1 hypothetical protein AWM73_01415 [Aerococcus urinae]MCY3031975.1 biotin transporter BioY [Aerococcus urinae]MCY3037031.1 biotin transporter BioY [Aerococcus urinae]MCY3044022.1 biotin transporter BioY [Aerococcus urinae]MCY3046734.1 biotin transporter BioY [Aerococcus urinae]
MKTKEITRIALMIALLVIASQLTIPIGIVPFTLQTFAVNLIALFLKPKEAFLTTLLYLLGGLIGLPFFAGFHGGFQSVLTPSFGFIIGFLAAASLVSTYLAKQVNPGPKEYLVALVINYLVTNSIGFVYMAFILNSYMGKGLSIGGLLAIGITPFILAEILKSALAFVLALRLRPLLKRRNLLD